MKPESLEKIRRITLLTKRLRIANIFGHSRSHAKGSGLDFDQLKDYHEGDDIRAIAWQSSARMNKMMVKKFNEDKHRTILIAIDSSASTIYGHDTVLKNQLIEQIGAILAYAGILAGDAVGLLHSRGGAMTYLAPKAGQRQCHILLESLYTRKMGGILDMHAFVDCCAKIRKKNALLIVVSDFIHETVPLNKLALLSQMYDVRAIRVLDSFESEFPVAGLITMKDCETGQECVVDMRPKSTASFFLKRRLIKQKELFAHHGIPLCDIDQTSDTVESLRNFFKRTL